MKLTTAQAIALLSKQFGTDVEISDYDWIINTKTTDGHPNTLNGGVLVEVVYKSMVGGDVRDTGHASDWDVMWNVDARGPYITKYRVVK